jgi:hypothetical protein
MKADLAQLERITKRGHLDILRQERIILRFHNGDQSEAFETAWERLEAMVADLERLRNMQREMSSLPHSPDQPAVVIAPDLGWLLSCVGDACLRWRIRRSRR